MKYETVTSKDGLILGAELIVHDALFFFGSKNGSLNLIQSHFNQFAFSHIRQIHSDQFVEASVDEDLRVADAQWTKLKHLALKIVTADCMPILVSAPEFSFAIHAGWRGIINQLPQKALAFAKKTLSPDCSNWVIVVGPFIQWDSFEVASQLGNEFLSLGAQFNVPPQMILKKHLSDSKKVMVNLESLLIGQLGVLGIKENQLHLLKHDTLTDLNYNSFRRDGQKAGRNVSFVARLK